MDSSSQKGELKKNITEVKTFPVPFSLGEKKENRTITTNTLSKPSKEQIINQAFKFHSQGSISEAAKLYQYLINQGFTDHRVFFNYGIILSNTGKLKEAEFVYRKAIKLNPDYTNAHLNLGVILKNLGELNEAELLYRKAIELNPNYTDAHYNLGNILKDIGKLKEAELFARKAIELNPNYANAHLCLGVILKDLGKLNEAFDSFLKVIEIDPKVENSYISIVELFSDSNLSYLNKLKLENTLNLLLEKNDINHNKLFPAFQFLYSNKIINSLERFQSDFIKKDFLKNDDVLIKALKTMIYRDCKVEKLLTNIRKYICDLISQDKTEIINQNKLEFIIALGEQCFLNEYVYSVTKEENLMLDIIINRCINDELNEIRVSILSCYFPIYKLLDQIPSLQSFISSNQNFKALMILQISEPLEEIELSKNIKKLGKISDDISQKVKAQYEGNPYPRWRYGNTFKKEKSSISQSINSDIRPNCISINTDNNKLKVLIAGCGTGNQILQSQRYKNAQITAIDLSLSSLSYAQRKINELGINNVDLIQMDILEVNLLKKNFDIIECGGVLICMKDPNLGLQKLLGVSKKNSFLKLGLYSELARQDVVNARNYINRNKLHPNEKDIREFRKTALSGQSPEIKSIIKRSDFYTLSSCRDLCFHVQEHRFTINQLQETLKSNQLKFLGFLLPQSIKSLYQKYFPEDKKQTNLQNWARFEEKHPNTFIAMYQFWVSKKED